MSNMVELISFQSPTQPSVVCSAGKWREPGVSWSNRKMTKVFRTHRLYFVYCSTDYTPVCKTVASHQLDMLVSYMYLVSNWLFLWSTQAIGVLGSSPGDWGPFSFLYFHLITSKFIYFQHEARCSKNLYTGHNTSPENKTVTQGHSHVVYIAQGMSNVVESVSFHRVQRSMKSAEAKQTLYRNIIQWNPTQWTPLNRGRLLYNTHL